jgi:hypothetical protein
LRAIQELRGEVDALRREIRGGMSKTELPAAQHKAPSSPVEARLSPPRDTYDLWSFKPLQRPALPAVQNQRWPQDELDRFILARLEQAGIEPNPDADPRTLLRRIAFDLTGLPPTPQQIAAFEQSAIRNRGTHDSGSSAIENYVDDLLASPRFGERWGRHWLDVVRYADSIGRTWNAPFTYAWRYRDYVIESFNQDKPFDRFVIEQLAGDLLPARSVGEERANLTATGLLALGSLPLNGGRVEAFRMDRIDDQIDVTTRAFLGLTVACARCHDHKYDPVSMRDYYALAGIFYSTQTLPGQAQQGDMGAGGYVDAERLIRLPGRDGLTRTELVKGVHSMSDFREEWQRSREQTRYTTDPDVAMGVLDGEPTDCPLRIKGEPYDRDEAPPRGEVRIAGLPGLPPIPEDSSGRLQLAHWIASPEHPLTARVMANRVWRHLFGRGLAATVDNFGVNGTPPTHPKLLDHLAVRFIDEGWSVKRLIRSIVLSRTYATSSAGRADAKQRDANNELYWRRDMRRLEVEALRDTLLLVAGRLELEPPTGIQVAGMGGKGKNGVVRSLLPVEAPYRTVYLPVLRSLVPPLYSTFDFPDPCQISGTREVTTVAPQALFFMNGDFAVGCARDAAEGVLRHPDLNDRQRIALVYQQLLSRAPRGEETDDALSFLQSLDPPQGQRDAELYRWTALVQAILASGEFRYVL